MSRHLYHHTSHMALPRILASGELRPIIMRPERTAELNRQFPNVGDAPEFVHATSDPHRDGMSTIDLSIAGERGRALYEAGELLKVRFTVDGEDFEPWRTIVSREALWSQRFIDATAQGAQDNHSNSASWYSRREPLPLSKVIAIHVKRFKEPWLALEHHRIFSISDDPAIMGHQRCDLVHWSEHAVIDHNDAFTPLTATSAVRTLETAPDGVMTKAQFNELLKRTPEQTPPQHELTPDVLAFRSKSPDPLASVVSSFTAKTSAPPRQITSPVRYYIDPDLALSFEEDQIQAQKTRMTETGRWRLPNGGGRYTIRIAYQSIRNVGSMPGSLIARDELDAPGSKEHFVDVDMDGEKVLEITEVVRRHWPGASREEKQFYLEDMGGVLRAQLTSHYNRDMVSGWWEKDSWACARVSYAQREDLSWVAAQLLDLLVIILQDRSVHVVESEPRRPSKKWKLSGLYNAEQEVPEIAMYCPRRISVANHGGTHATPRMHYRAEHLRQQAYGPNRALRKEIVIEAQWINAVAEPPSEVPSRCYRLKT